MKLRTISGAAEYFRHVDANTAVTAYAIRQAVITGAVQSVRAGQKYLVAIETLESYFAGQVQQETPAQSGIRAVR